VGWSFLVFVASSRWRDPSVCGRARPARAWCVSSPVR